MNQTLQDFARKSIIEGLQQLPTGWQDRFRLMYGRSGGARSVNDTMAMPISDVVHEIAADQLDWALTQVENSLKKQHPGQTLAHPLRDTAPAEAEQDQGEPNYEGKNTPPLGYAPADAAEAATGEDDALDRILGWVCVHKDNPQPLLVPLADRKVVAMRKKLPNTWKVYTVTRRSAMLASPAWAAAMSEWVVGRLSPK